MQIASRVWCGLLFLSGSTGYLQCLGGIGARLAHAVTRRYDGRADYRDIPSLGIRRVCSRRLI